MKNENEGVVWLTGAAQWKLKNIEQRTRNMIGKFWISRYPASLVPCSLFYNFPA
jgi:hypothetical protein